tara:strand:+ start:1039 stop:1413 length:375 start_codon:yes stop_codon:yes gene_type:complete
MASTLQATGFHDAVDYKVIKASLLDNGTDVQKNVTGGPGRLHSIRLDGSNAGADYWIKIFDGGNPSPGSSVPQLILKGKSLSVTAYQIPYGYAFTELSFWVTSTSNQTSTGNLTGNATVELICS